MFLIIDYPLTIGYAIAYPFSKVYIFHSATKKGT